MIPSGMKISFDIMLSASWLAGFIIAGLLYPIVWYLLKRIKK